MSVRAYRDIHRRKSRQIMVGKVAVGGDAPITVQTMTNTITGDARATIDQIRRIEDAGADIVRVSCPDEDATKAMKAITTAASIPVVADIHFHYKRAIEAAVNGAACLRINPGNIGSPQRVREVVQAAKDHGCSMRIGVNAGSLEADLLEKYGEPCPDAMFESALNHARILDDLDFRDYKISVKASDPFLAVAAYQALDVIRTVDTAHSTINLAVTVPPVKGSFDAVQRAKVSQDHLWCYMDVSTAATVTPVGDAPAPGYFGDFTKPQQYKVTAADGSSQVWTLVITSFVK